MFVLGIDPGLTRTGYGIVEKRRSGIHPVAVGVIRTDPQTPMAERLLEIHGDLSELLDEHSIEAAAIEQVFSNLNRATITGVGRASGVAMLALAQRSIPVVEYTPSAVKMALTGFGGADKAQVQKVIQMRLGLAAPPRPADAADALAIALCHVQAAGMNRRIQRSVASSCSGDRCDRATQGSSCRKARGAGAARRCRGRLRDCGATAGARRASRNR